MLAFVGHACSNGLMSVMYIGKEKFVGQTDKSRWPIWPWKVGQRSDLIWDIGKIHQMYHFGIVVMFCWGNIALTSKVQGRDDLSDLEKWVKDQPRSLPFELFWDIGKMQQMYRFVIDVMLRSGNFGVASKVKVKVTMPRSKVREPK